MKIGTGTVAAVLLAAGVTTQAAEAQAVQPGGPPEAAVKSLFATVCDRGCSEEEVAGWRANLKSETHDLNGDGVVEVFLFIQHSDWCGAGANCDYWIFQKRGGGYALLLNDKNLRPGRNASHGYLDLTSEKPMGFCGKNVQRLSVTPYRFDGTRYAARRRRTECRPLTPPVEP